MKPADDAIDAYRKRARVRIDYHKRKLRKLLASGGEDAISLVTTLIETAVEWRIKELGLDVADDLTTRQVRRVLKRHKH